jgi:hypothetical protein
MLKVTRYLASLAFVALVILVVAWVVSTSLDFQQCVEASGQESPPSEHLEESISIFIRVIPTYRHCVGMYVTDKNQVITALGTVVIAIFTTILGIFTISLSHATRVAADAAKLNAQAVIDAERAHLYVIVKQHNVSELIDAISGVKWRDEIAKDRMEPPILSYNLKNYGKTPATLESVSHCLQIQTGEGGERIFEMPERAIEILGEREETDPDIVLRFEQRQFLCEDARALGEHDTMLFFYSEAIYKDIFNRQHTVRSDFLYSAGRFHQISREEKSET